MRRSVPAPKTAPEKTGAHCCSVALISSQLASPLTQDCTQFGICAGRLRQPPQGLRVPRAQRTLAQCYLGPAAQLAGKLCHDL